MANAFNLASEVNTLKRIEYASVSALTLILYDVLLMLPSEIQLVWKTLKSRITCATAFYIVCRYGLLLDSFLYVLVAFPTTGHSNAWIRYKTSIHFLLRCEGILTFTVVTLLCVEASGHCITLFSIFVLWERNRRIKYIMMAIVTISYIVAFAMLIKLIIPIIRDTTFISFPTGELTIRACASVFDPKLTLSLWTPAVFIDACAIVLMWWNALDQPRSANDRVIKVLEHDGILLLVVGFCLRLSTILIASAGSLSVVLLVGFNAEFVNTILNIRLFLKLQERSGQLSLEQTYEMDGRDKVTGTACNASFVRMPHGGEQFIYDK